MLLRKTDQALGELARKRADDLVGLAGSGGRMAFYERAKKAYCVIATGERRFYGCFIFKKGVVPPPAA